VSTVIFTVNLSPSPIPDRLLHQPHGDRPSRSIDGGCPRHGLQPKIPWPVFDARVLVLIKYFKPEPRVALEVPPEEEPLLSTTSLNSNVVQKELHSLSFDMILARVSMAIEIVAYGAMGLSSSGLPFVISSLFLWFGSAVNPAVQSVALAIYTRNGGTESGRLFGALSVVQALWSVSNYARMRRLTRCIAPK
jgi:hypothetical protein